MRIIFLALLVFMLVGCCTMEKCRQKYESVTAIGDYRDKDFKVIREYKESIIKINRPPIPRVFIVYNGQKYADIGSENYPPEAVICGGGYTDKYENIWDSVCPDYPVCYQDECCFRKRIGEKQKLCPTCWRLEPPKQEEICK